MLPPSLNIPSPLVLARWLKAPIPFLEESARHFGDAFTLRLFASPPIVILSNPEDIKEVFAFGPDDAHAGKANYILKPFFGDHSVLLLDGARHSRQRKLLMPPFNGERLAAYGKQMVSETEVSVRDWPRKEPFALHPLFQDITLQIILRTVFGLVDDAKRARIAALLKEVLHRGTNPLNLMHFFQVDGGPLTPWGRFKRAEKKADAALYAEIDERRRAPDLASKDDILSMLLSARDEDGAPMGDAELRDELVTLLVAGHETTATALAWTFQWLLSAPDALAKVTAEARSAVKDGVLQSERIAKLEMLDATVREGLRLVPVIPIVARELQKPRRLAGYDLPQGTMVAPSIYLTSRRPDIFPEPAEFRPARFLNGRKPAPYEWFPFGGGIRRCIGMAFALYEMKLVLATVLSRVTLELADNAPPSIVRRAITLAPRNGVRVRIR